MYIQQRKISKRRAYKLMKRGESIGFDTGYYWRMWRKGPMLVVMRYHDEIVVRGKLPFYVSPRAKFVRIIIVADVIKEYRVQQAVLNTAPYMCCDVIEVKNESEFNTLLGANAIDIARIDKRRGTVK